MLSLILALGLFIFPALSEGEHACPNCGHRFPEDSIPKFCTSCGTSIQACRVCGFLFEAGNIPAFCTNCGASQVYAGDNNPAAGDGHFLSTYKHDGNPLPSFEGEPKCIAIPDDIDGFASMLWESLNEDNKVSLFVRYIDIADGSYETRIINKNK